MADAAPFAEVIGDPIAHSLSPAIHRHWLEATATEGAYRAVRCRLEELAAYLAERRRDPDWRGANVTMPLKQDVLPLMDAVDPGAAATGAVNCIIARAGRLIGFNTDVDGIAAALGGEELAGRRAVLIGAGGAARAALVELVRRGAVPLVLARDPAKASALAQLAPDLRIMPLEAARSALAGAAAIVNASPLGMNGAPPMPADLLSALRSAPGAVAFDMVYRPLDTDFLRAGRAAGLRTADGLAMLIGQARRAFELFFGRPAPPGDAAIRTLLRAG